MTLSEFVLQYELHDSLLEAVWVDRSARTARLEIDLCWWMQWWFSEDLPETGRVFAAFSGLEALRFEPGDGGSGQILKMAFYEAENELRLDVLSDDGRDVYRLCIRAKQVEVRAAEPLAQSCLFPEQIPEGVELGDYPKGTLFALICDEPRERDPVSFQLLPRPKRPLMYPQNVKGPENE